MAHDWNFFAAGTPDGQVHCIALCGVNAGEHQPDGEDHLRGGHVAAAENKRGGPKGFAESGSDARTLDT